MYEDIKQNVSRIIIAIIILLSVMYVIAFLKEKYDNYKSPKYSVAICKVNDEEIEIKIKKMQKTDNGQYHITDYEDVNWLLSTQHCILK